jgi:hypothetical protein
MGGLVGFLLGYYVGAKDGPERLEQLLRSAQEILNSSEFQGLQASLMALAQQTLGQLQQNVAPKAGSDAISAGEAWKVISESAEFRGLLAAGTSLIQGVLSTVAPQARGNGHAPL